MRHCGAGPVTTCVCMCVRVYVYACVWAFWQKRELTSWQPTSCSTECYSPDSTYPQEALLIAWLTLSPDRHPDQPLPTQLCSERQTTHTHQTSSKINPVQFRATHTHTISTAPHTALQLRLILILHISHHRDTPSLHGLLVRSKQRE